MFLAFGLIWVGYLLGWYGYATLQQPTGATASGIGITDLILPSRIQQVDIAIQHNWFKDIGGAGAGATTPGPNYTGPRCPDGSIPLYVTANGQPICGTVGA